MKIAYGVSGEGLGHVYEAIQVVSRLTQEGHVVKVMTYGDRALRSLAPFNPMRIEGVHLYFDATGLSLRRTIRRNFKCIPFFVRNWRCLRRELEAFDPDVFVTAYEPFSMLASHAMRRPLISMDNQNELLHVDAPLGTRRFPLWLARTATRVCTYRADYYVIKSLTKTQPSGPKHRFVFPVIQDAIRAIRPTQGDHLLVYLTKPNPALIDVLKSVGETFYVYCGLPAGDAGNVHFRQQGDGFLKDLGGCKAIIGTTGFSLISDALYLKKPYYGVPLAGQFEQTYNAQFIRDLGVGEFSETVGKPDLERFLANLPKYRVQLERHGLDPAEQEETLLGLLEEISSERARPVLVS